MVLMQNIAQDYKGLHIFEKTMQEFLRKAQEKREEVFN